MDYNKESLRVHKEKKGKLAVALKVPLKTQDDLSVGYTPGVAEPCRVIAEDKEQAYTYTIKGNTVAVVSDGTAVLGLGNIGGLASLPVMEGKAILFKEFADIDAFPIVLEKDADIVQTIKNISPTFGGINLEDIGAPQCFEVEEQLQDIGIPVFHDDQHGTAIVIYGALINAAKLVNKKIEDLTVVMSGAGAAGIAVAKMLKCMGFDNKVCTSVKDIFMCDSKGIISKNRTDLNDMKQMVAKSTNKENRDGTLADAMKGADVFLGVSKGNLVTKEMVQSMNKDAIVFAMANPIPEIMPKEAKAGGAAIVGTGRSDFPNQVNNVLAFPGVFRGALDANATKITNEMKLAAAKALAEYVKVPTPEEVLPSILDKRVTDVVAKAVAKAAVEGKVIRKSAQ